MHPTTAAGQPLRGNVGRMALHCHPRRAGLSDRISSIKSQTIHQGVPTWDIEAGLKQMLSKRPRFSRNGGGPGLHHLQTVRPTGPVSRVSGAGRTSRDSPVIWDVFNFTRIQIRSFMMMFFALIIMLRDTRFPFLEETITFRFIFIICVMFLVSSFELFSTFQIVEEAHKFHHSGSKILGGGWWQRTQQIICSC